MLLLIAVGFAAGVITALSPCVLPVLPIVLAGGATNRKPVWIVVGLVGSFTLFTLGAAWLLDLLGLPADFLRNLAIALLVLVAVTLLVPQVGEWLSRMLARLGRRPAGDLGGGVLLGASLGLVFVPCAGPVLAAMTALAAAGEVGVRTVVLTLSYAVGAAIPLLAVALLGRRAADALRGRAFAVRRVAGVLMLAAAVAIAAGFDRRLQTEVPGYTQALQDRIEGSTAAQRKLATLTGAHAPIASPSTGDAATLPDYGPAPEFTNVQTWLDSKPLTMTELRGKVVLIDFWTYSCVNCLRTLPHVRAWDARYRDSGLVVVGVHTPEFAFERVVGNVRENARQLGVRYPIAIDNAYGTWNAWGNQYWPAKYLVDRKGQVRYAHFGEGDYGATEDAIRELLAEGSSDLPASVGGADPNPTPSPLQTPETYLGYQRLTRYAGETVQVGRLHDYRLPAKLPPDELAYGGTWRVQPDRATAGPGARLRLQYHARAANLVLSGRGTVRVFVDGREQAPVRVTEDRLYTMARLPKAGDHLLELRFTPGLDAWAFTFG